MSATTKKKHVERELYEDFTLPGEHQVIVKVVRPRGNNLHQVITAEGEEYLVTMPLKFRKHVWIKRGDFVVTEAIPEGNKVRAEIVRILLKDHIRYLTQNNMWPKEFMKQTGEQKEEAGKTQSSAQKDRGSDSDSDNNDLLMENPNRRTVFVEDSTDSDDETSDSDSDNDPLEENPNRKRVTIQASESESGAEDSPDEND